MRAAACLHGANALGLQRVIFGEELPILLGEDVVGDRGDAHALAQPFAKLEHQRRLPAADRATHTHGERALLEISIQRTVSIVEVSGVFEMLARFATWFEVKTSQS